MVSRAPCSLYSAPAPEPQISPFNDTMADQQQEEEVKPGFLDNAVKHIFGKCAGIMDVASLLIQSGCRGESAVDVHEPVDENEVEEVHHRKTLKTQRTRKRQGDLLEFPTHGGFDDDVSAISAHTLEEMERLRMLSKMRQTLSMPKRPQSKTLTRAYRNGQKLRMPPKDQELDWAYQMPRQISNHSIAESTSGSSDTSPPRYEQVLRP